jgi:hypothetical protein
MYTIGFAIIMSMGPAQGSAAGTERMVAMTTDHQRIKELEKQMKAQRDEIAAYRVYFQACAESETDPGKKDSTSSWPMQRTWNPSQNCIVRSEASPVWAPGHAYADGAKKSVFVSL